MNLMSFLTPKDSTYYLEADSTIRQALEKFDYHKFSIVPLIDEEGHFISTISEGDILRYVKNNCNFDIELAENVRIDELEKYRPYKSMDITCNAKEAFHLLLDQNFIPMVDGRGMFIGIIKRREVLMYLYDNLMDKE